MKTFKIAALTTTLMTLTLLSCNQSSNNSGQTTPEGTVQTNSVNSEMEDHRSSANVDSVTSPGSNSYDLSTRNSGATGTTTDNNMQNQDDTHGRSTQSGDNGSGQ